MTLSSTEISKICDKVEISILRPAYELVNLCSLNLTYIVPDAQLAFTCSKLTTEILEQKCEICSKLTIMPPKRRQWHCFGGFILNFEHISHLFSSVSIVNFEHVITGWVETTPLPKKYFEMRSFTVSLQLNF